MIIELGNNKRDGDSSQKGDKRKWCWYNPDRLGIV